jgi:hypothetical protein
MCHQVVFCRLNARAAADKKISRRVFLFAIYNVSVYFHMSLNGNMSFVLEVQRHGCYAGTRLPVREHVGYMYGCFETRQQACNHYHALFPNMRRLEAHGGCHSDWDPANHNWLFVVREYHHENMSVASNGRELLPVCDVCNQPLMITSQTPMVWKCIAHGFGADDIHHVPGGRAYRAATVLATREDASSSDDEFPHA